MENLKPIPKIGEYYHFFDDGKVSPSRHYIAKCEEIITLTEARSIRINHFGTNIDLLNIWVNEKNNHGIYSKNTDYIIKCSIPDFDNDPIYFVRDISGGWFSIDVTNGWQAGRLDIDSYIYNSNIEYLE